MRQPPPVSGLCLGCAGLCRLPLEILACAPPNEEPYRVFLGPAPSAIARDRCTAYGQLRPVRRPVCDRWSRDRSTLIATPEGSQACGYEFASSRRRVRRRTRCTNIPAPDGFWLSRGSRAWCAEVSYPFPTELGVVRCRCGPTGKLFWPVTTHCPCAHSGYSGTVVRASVSGCLE